VLSDLTEDHLRELGLPLGARIKLLKAIAALPKKTTIGAAVGMAVSSSPGDAAERRQVTVMFSDLVGSTALSTRMDPEDLRKLISAYQKCVTETVQRYGGICREIHGAMGVLVYFGYPQAHEHDAERAVRSALDLVVAVGEIEDQHAAGRPASELPRGWWWSATSSDPARPRSEASSARRPTSRPGCKGSPNRTWLLSRTPQEGFWAICSSCVILVTRSSRDSRVRCRSGPHCDRRLWKAGLKPFTVATSLRLSDGRRKSQLLRRRWSRAKDGEGQVVLISGEAGIGKSRLTAVLLEQIKEEPHARLRCFCSPQRTNSALSPIIGHMERAGRIGARR